MSDFAYPTSCAWSWFTTRIRVVSRPILTAVCPRQYDAVLLHCVLGHPIKEAAALMGEHPSSVRYLTRRHQEPHTQAPRRPLDQASQENR